MKVSPDNSSGSFPVYQNSPLQTNLEEAKGQEIIKLQNSMQGIHAMVGETYALLTRERESAQKAIEEASTIVRETAPIHVEDTEKIAKISARMEEFKGAREMDALQEAKDKLQAQVEDLTWRLHFEKHSKTGLEEAKGQEILKLKNSLEDMRKHTEKYLLISGQYESAQLKIDYLNVEVEELKSLLESMRNRKQVESSEFKQQKLEETVNRMNQLQKSRDRLEEKLINIELENKILRQKTSTMAGRLKSLLDPHHPRMKLGDADVVEILRKALNEKQQEYQDLLIRCISEHLGFSKGRPLSACIIYKCLRQWRSFEVERTSIFDRIIQTIGKAIQTQENNNEVLSYWLSNASTLLVLLQHTFKAKDHALLFKYQLTSYVEKIYLIIRENLMKEISPSLVLIIQAPINFASELRNRRVDSQDILIAHWQELVNNFNSFLNVLKSNHVSPFLVRKLFTQMFYFINKKLFNSILESQECCSFSNGEYVKAGLSKLEHWCHKATEEYAGLAWEELKHIRQAVGLLVIDQKPKTTLDKIINEMCRALNIQQLYRISDGYQDDKYGTDSFSPDVIKIMRVLMDRDLNNAESSSLLLDDDSSIPFSVDDLSIYMDQINIADVEPPIVLCDSSDFRFLVPRAES